MKILGIDEAGRGPVCGPLVMCGYLIDDSKLAGLRKTGVRDSKMLSPERRLKMHPVLESFADDYIILEKSAQEIDSMRSVSNLNRMEIDMMAEIINAFRPDKAIVDAPEFNTLEFSRKLMRKAEGVNIIAENYADKNHVEVSAASVMAKVRRDTEIEKLHKIHGYFGSGYPSDPDTISFLKNWIKKNKEFPDFVRKSWITAQAMIADKEQKPLSSFMVKSE